MTTEPTDAEISALYAEQTGFDLNESPAALMDFARAVLAKWGRPSGAGEPVAYVEVTQKRSEVSMTWCPEPAGFSLPTGRYRLYTTPQPTQAQAGPVPLTDDELLAMWAGGDERFMRPVLGKNKVLAFGRAVEHRHGIKGGQHGTDN